MRNHSTQISSYKIKETYRKQVFGAVINCDRDTRSWSWKGHIDFEDGPYSEYSGRRTFTTGSEAEEHMRRFAREQIDNWLLVRRPSDL